MIIWKSANGVVSFNWSSTVYTKSVSPELVALKSAFLFSPNFNRRGTCRLDFGSNSRSCARKKNSAKLSGHLLHGIRIDVDLLLSPNFCVPFLVLSSQYCKKKCLERQAHAIYLKFSAQHRHHLKIKGAKLSKSMLGEKFINAESTFVVSDFMECPMLENPRLGQFQVFRNLNGQTVMLPEYQSIEYYIRFQMVESVKCKTISLNFNSHD